MDIAGLKRDLKPVLQGHVGRGNEISGKELAQMFGMKDDRRIRLAIDSLIDDYWAVCSATDEDKKQGWKPGYFRPATLEEARDCYGKWRHRGIDTCVRARKMFKAAKLHFEHAEQLELMPV